MIDSKAFQDNIMDLWSKTEFPENPDMREHPFLHITHSHGEFMDNLDSITPEVIAQMRDGGWKLEFTNDMIGLSAYAAIDKMISNPSEQDKDELNYFLNSCLAHIAPYIAYDIDKGMSAKNEYDPEILKAADHDFHNLMPFEKAAKIFRAISDAEIVQREKGNDTFIDRWAETPEAADLCLSKGFALEQEYPDGDIILYKTWCDADDDMTVKKKIAIVTEEVFNNHPLFKKITDENELKQDGALTRLWSYPSPEANSPKF